MKKEFANKEEYQKYVVENNDELLSVKKMETKHADCIISIPSFNQDKTVEKSEETTDVNKITVKVVINTTNLYDSHDDVHIDGLWKKTLQEKRKIYLLQEHKASFDSVISRNVKSYTEQKTFKELGYKFDSTTQALIFDAEIKREDNPYMFEQYRKGYVDNHSVGMRYVSLYLCVDSNEKWAEEEKKNWDKYIKYVANPEEIKWGVFYAVTEAKLIEGSAVLFGSNYATPTIEVQESKSDEPEESTQTEQKIEPPSSTQKWSEVLRALKN